MPFEEEAKKIFDMLGIISYDEKDVKMIAKYLDGLIAQEVEEALADQPEPIGEPLEWSELD